jgi:cob(I)alamin adenosyltransferase
MKIYTKKGDKGETSLIGGSRVSKNHIRIEAYGTVDELNSYIGLIRDQEINTSHYTVLLEIQDRLFTLGSLLAAEPGKSKMKLPELKPDDIVYLENQIDLMDKTLTPMQSFVLPGGHTTVSYCHIARCVCRRAERNCVALSNVSEVDIILLSYLNRLSDYLFTLSRMLTIELKAVEKPWVPRY